MDMRCEMAGYPIISDNFGIRDEVIRKTKHVLSLHGIIQMNSHQVMLNLMLIDLK